MTHIRFSRTTRFAPDQMLALIADVERYPEFVPNCADMEVSRSPSRPNQCDARMSVTFGPVSGAYTSQVSVDPEKRTVKAIALDGPFRHLDSQWTLTPDGEGTLATFELDFAFSNPLLSAVAEPVFAAKQEEIIDAFMARAEQLYG